MTITKAGRLKLARYTSPGDTHPKRDDFNGMIAGIEDQVVIGLQGARSERPAPGPDRRAFFEKDTGRLWWDTGTDWKEITTNGGGGVPAPVAVGGAGGEGASERSARADHSHALPLATNGKPGAMSAADKTRLDGTASQDALTTGLAGKANTSHSHDASAITSGVVDRARLPNATDGASGLISADNNYLLNHATDAGEARTLVRRNSAGGFRVSTPASGLDAANADYVNSQVGDARSALQSAINGKANTSHQHSASAITSGTFDPARIVGSDRAWNTGMPSTAATVAVSPDGLFSRWTSSIRYKKNVRDGVDGLNLIEQMRPVTADYKTAHGGQADVPCLIAEELDELVPFAVYKDADGRPDGINYQFLVPHLVEAVQELAALIREKGATA